MRPRDTRRHFLPAGSIGYFSFARQPPQLRKRPIYVLRKERSQPYITTPENVGLRKHLYGYGREWDWDSYFKTGERYVHQPVDALMKAGPGQFDLQDWIRVVWYVSTLITRGPDLEFEVERKAIQMGIDPRTASPGYILNAQRAGVAVLRARWALEWSIERDFIFPDRGVTGLFYPPWDTYAYHIPLRKNFAVLLGAGPYPKKAVPAANTWQIQLEYQMRRAAGTDVINSLAWLASRDECYGPNSSQLLQAREQAAQLPEQSRAVAQAYGGAQLLGLSVEERMRDELLLLSLVAGVRPPNAGGPTELLL